MAGSILADTGGLLAVLDRGDRWHRVCIDAFAGFELPLLTTEAVLTELFHLVGPGRRRIDAAWRLVLSGALEIAPIRGEDLPALHRLMTRYADRPMDFADATLVHVAEREAISTVFTVDRADFETYRIGGRQRFRLLPGAKP